MPKLITNKIYGYIRRMELFSFEEGEDAAFTLTIPLDLTISQNTWLKRSGAISPFL